MLKVTDQLGKVMEESTQIAYTVARSRVAEVDDPSSYFDDMFLKEQRTGHQQESQ